MTGPEAEPLPRLPYSSLAVIAVPQPAPYPKLITMVLGI
jgi:hypothetical protein